MKILILILTIIYTLNANEVIYVSTLFDGFYQKNQFKNLTNELLKMNLNCYQSENEFKCDISNEEFYNGVKKIEDKFKINTYILENNNDSTLGIKVEKLNDKFVITHLYQNSQALERLKNNDIVLSIDNIELNKEMSVFQILNLLNGPNNSVVLLKILRGDDIIQRTVKRKSEQYLSKTINYKFENKNLYMNIEDIHKDLILKYDTYHQISSILNENKDIKSITIDLSHMTKNNTDYYLLKNVLSLFINSNSCLYAIIDNNGKVSLCTKDKPLINNKVTMKVEVSNKTNYQGLIFAYLLKKHYQSKVEVNLPKLLNFEKTINLHKKNHLDKFNFIYPNGILEVY